MLPMQNCIMRPLKIFFRGWTLTRRSLRSASLQWSLMGKHHGGWAKRKGESAGGGNRLGKGNAAQWCAMG